jgi:hypothetical protein
MLELLMNDIGEGLEEEESYRMRVLSVAQVLKECDPVLVVVFNELITVISSPVMLLQGRRLLSQHKTHRQL